MNRPIGRTRFTQLPLFLAGTAYALGHVAATFAQEAPTAAATQQQAPPAATLPANPVPPVTKPSTETKGESANPAVKPDQPPVGQPPVGQPPVDLPKPVEEARTEYLGRMLAEPMSHLGASWLIRPERNFEENATQAFGQLRLKPGMKVCDLGCGNGYWTLPIARDLGPTGVVYAVDIQIEMLQQLKARAANLNLTTVEPILGDVDNPRLPADVKLDLVLLVDVYHEFSHPQSMLWEIRRALAPEGVIALLEYRQEDLNVPIKPLHKMSKNQILKEYEANGLKLVREYNELPWQHLMFFARDDSPLPKIEAEPFLPK
jgi:ubiquinone/menaquinone biosynthesis C-methylase UbiE